MQDVEFTHYGQCLDQVTLPAVSSSHARNEKKWSSHKQQGVLTSALLMQNALSLHLKSDCCGIIPACVQGLRTQNLFLERHSARTCYLRPLDRVRQSSKCMMATQTLHKNVKNSFRFIQRIPVHENIHTGRQWEETNNIQAS